MPVEVIADHPEAILQHWSPHGGIPEKERAVVLEKVTSHGEDRDSAVMVHQLRAGHWERSSQYIHRIDRLPSLGCPQCPDMRCPAALCAVCREEADVPEHVLLRCRLSLAPGFG